MADLRARVNATTCFFFFFFFNRFVNDLRIKATKRWTFNRRFLDEPFTRSVASKICSVAFTELGIIREQWLRFDVNSIYRYTFRCTLLALTRRIINISIGTNWRTTRRIRRANHFGFQCWTYKNSIFLPPFELIRVNQSAMADISRENQKKKKKKLFESPKMHGRANP